MPYVFQDGALEPEEIQEPMRQIADELNAAYMESHGFVVMTDSFDDPVILRLDSITKIKVSP